MLSDVFVFSVSLTTPSPSHFTFYLALAAAATIVPCFPLLSFFFSHPPHGGGLVLVLNNGKARLI